MMSHLSPWRRSLTNLAARKSRRNPSFALDPSEFGNRDKAELITDPNTVTKSHKFHASQKYLREHTKFCYSFVLGSGIGVKNIVYLDGKGSLVKKYPWVCASVCACVPFRGCLCVNVSTCVC